ncbi:MAG: hypothetical protein ABI073_00455 [Luteolibacter sp.]
MNPLLLIFCLILIGLQLGLSRKWAFLPLLIAACHTPYTPFMMGLTVTRVVLIVGLARAGAKGWFSWNPRNPLDFLMAAFATIALLATVGHEWEAYNPLIVRLRLVVDVCGTYLYARAYLNERETLDRFAAGLALVMLPFAIFMFVEKQSGLNPYRWIGADNVLSLVRDGKIRAQGPFGTPILSGTVGASSIPFFLPLWRTRRGLAVVGLGASVLVMLTSASSGPISTAGIGLAAVAFWYGRSYVKAVSILIVVTLVVLHLVKDRPVWYLMALMDFVGGSTGWHRAYLIDMAVQHWDEWWLVGSDHTRHWMPYGLAAVPEHCDLTNYYIHLGVTSGLPLALCLLMIQWKSFKMLSNGLRQTAGTPDEFRYWCLGAAFFAHGVTFLSISYFDQMYVFFWVLVGGMTGFLKAEDRATDEDTATKVMEPHCDSYWSPPKPRFDS